MTVKYVAKHTFDKISPSSQTTHWHQKSNELISKHTFDKISPSSQTTHWHQKSNELRAHLWLWTLLALPRQSCNSPHLFPGQSKQALTFAAAFSVFNIIHVKREEEEGGADEEEENDNDNSERNKERKAMFVHNVSASNIKRSACYADANV